MFGKRSEILVGGGGGSIFVAIFHLILPQEVYTRIFNTLGRSLLVEKFVWVGGSKVNLELVSGQNQDLGFGFGLGPS